MARSSKKKEPDDLWFQAGLFAAVVICIGLVSAAIELRWSLWDLAESYKQNTKQIDAETNDIIEKRCALLPSPAKDECVTDTHKSAQNAKRDEADLYAQRKMAEWAFAVGVTAFISVCLSLIGIFFIWRSLKLNRDAVAAATRSNNVAREAGQNQVRAYLTCIGGAYQIKRDGLMIHPVLRNTGQSPATNIVIQGTVHVSIPVKHGLGSVEMPEDVVRLLKPYVRIGGDFTSEGSCEVISASEPRSGLIGWILGKIGKENITALLEENAKFDVRLLITWNDVYGDSQSIKVLLNSDPERQTTAADSSIRTGAMISYNQSIHQHPTNQPRSHG